LLAPAYWKFESSPDRIISLPSKQPLEILVPDALEENNVN